MPRKYTKDQLRHMSERELYAAGGETLKAIFSPIGDFFRNRREAKEEAARLERERIERQRKAEAQAKIIKNVLLCILVIAVIIGIVFVIMNGSVLKNFSLFFTGIFDAVKDFFAMAGDFCSNVFSKIENFIKTVWPFGKK
jgi:hypothetical protein